MSLMGVSEGYIYYILNLNIIVINVEVVAFFL